MLYASQDNCVTRRAWDYPRVRIGGGKVRIASPDKTLGVRRDFAIVRARRQGGGLHSYILLYTGLPQTAAEVKAGVLHSEHPNLEYFVMPHAGLPGIRESVGLVESNVIRFDQSTYSEITEWNKANLRMRKTSQKR